MKKGFINLAIIFLLIMSTFSCATGKGSKEREAGKKYYRQADYVMAVIKYSEAIKKNSDYWKLYFYRGIAYQKLNKIDLAIADLGTCLKLIPKSETWYGKMASDERALIYVRRGMLYHKKNEYKLAIDDYNEALELDSQTVGAYFYRGVTKGKMNLLSEAIEDYSKAVNMMSKILSGISDSEKIRIYRNRAKLFLKQGKADLALSDINSALEINPNSANLYEKRGIIYAKIGAFEKAIHDLDKAIEIAPSYNAYTWRAGVRLIASCDLKKVLEDYHSVIDMKNVNNDILLKVFNDVAWILATASDNAVRNPEKAAEYAKKSIAIKSDLGNLDTLAVAFAGCGKFEEAINTVNQAIDLCKSERSEALSELEKHLETFKLKKDLREECPARKQIQETLQTWLP